MYTFVAADETGSPQKRQQTARACESCRRRKKRCQHTKSSDSIASQKSIGGPSAYPRHLASTPPTNTAHLITTESASFQSQNILQDGERLPHKPPAVFSVEPRVHVGDIDGRDSPNGGTGNPPNPTRDGQLQENRSSRFIGDLNPEGIFLAATNPGATRGVSLDESIGVWLTSNLTRRDSESTTHTVPSPSNLFYGSGSMVQKVLLPLLEQECLSVISPPASLDFLKKLYFEKVHPIFPVIDRRIYDSFESTDPCRILLEQGICLASSKNFAAKEHLYLPVTKSPLSCREFGERLSSAMRLIIELGLIKDKIVTIQALALMSQFTDSPIGHDISAQLCGRAVHYVHTLGLQLEGQKEDDSNSYNITLLCCVYAIDRMNAAFYGRPTLMHERDFRKDFEHCITLQEPCFRLLLHIVTLLDNVIALYRPVDGTTDPGLEWEFPSFEDVVLTSSAQHIGPLSLATIEIFYHAISILSCRSRPWSTPYRASAAFLRQSLSTSTLSSLTSGELHDHLVLFPFIPYAVSLSLSIAYREMRHSKLSLHRSRARNQFQTICDLLKELEGTFWTAKTAAEMGTKMVKEMDRVLAEATGGDRRAAGELLVDGGTEPGSDPGPQKGLARGDQTQTTDSDLLLHTPYQEFDPSVFDPMLDIDLFGMFDPAFNLDEFDATLEGNLNPAFPMSFQ